MVFIKLDRDRQVYAWTKDDNGALVSKPLDIEISHNFVFANYGAGQAVDNDDGSAWYNIHHNVFYLGGGLKSDYAGHDKQYHHNLNIGLNGFGVCGNFCEYEAGHADSCFNNTAIQANNDRANVYATLRGCNMSLPGCLAFKEEASDHLGLLVMHDNVVWNTNATLPVQCGGVDYTIQELFDGCGVGAGDRVTAELPSDEEIVGWARTLLGM